MPKYRKVCGAPLACMCLECVARRATEAERARIIKIVEDMHGGVNSYIYRPDLLGRIEGGDDA